MVIQNKISGGGIFPPVDPALERSENNGPAGAAVPAESFVPASFGDSASASSRKGTAAAGGTGAAGAGKWYSGDSYGTLVPWMEDYLERHKPKSKEELEKERRRQRTQGIVAGISDAARAVANLFFTHHYAPDMYKGGSGMSDRVRERFERAKAEREAEDERYFQMAMTLGRLKDAREQREYQRGRDALQDEILREKGDAEVARLLALAEEALRRGDSLEADKLLKEAQKVKVQTETEWIPRTKASEVRRNNAAATASNASANASNARARASNMDANTKGMHFDGRTYYTEEDYEKAVYRAAREYNTRARRNGYKDRDGKPVDEVEVEWVDYATGKPHLYKASDIASQMEPLLEAERKKNRKKPTGVKWK